jgi:hypothetical protein
MRIRGVGALLIVTAAGLGGATAPGAPPDRRAVKLARAVLERLGGEARWAATRHVRWRFFGGRLHHWDRHTGDIRIDSPERRDEQGRVERPATLVLMNLHTGRGRAWKEGQPVVDPAELAAALELGRRWWVNDSYWMFMPYKLLDPGVTLRYLGERPLEAGGRADVLELTFAPGVGDTPENRYEVYVNRKTRLVELWKYYESADDAEPQLTAPWSGWRRFGEIWLATDHGQDKDWEIAVFDTLPRSAYEDPGPVRS